jgi:hypothetical protein
LMASGLVPKTNRTEVRDNSTVVARGARFTQSPRRFGFAQRPQRTQRRTGAEMGEGLRRTGVRLGLFPDFGFLCALCANRMARASFEAEGARTRMTAGVL